MSSNMKQGRDCLGQYRLGGDCQSNYVHKCVFGTSKANVCQAISYMPQYDNIDILKRLLQQYMCQRINEAEILRNLPSEFSTTLAMHMKKSKYRLEQLSKTSLVSERTIQRMLSNEAYNTSLNTVIALCIGLKLPPLFSFDLVEKSGYCFKRTSDHVGYRAILLSRYQCDIYECNELLKYKNIPLLGNKEFF